MSNSIIPLSPAPLDPKTVKKRLIDLEMTQRQLITYCGISTATVVRYINGHGLNLHIQQAIARVLKQPLNTLWQEKP